MNSTGVGIFAHHPFGRGQSHLQEHRERQLDTQNHLRNDKSVKGILNKEDKNQCYPKEIKIPTLEWISLI